MELITDLGHVYKTIAEYGLEHWIPLLIIMLVSFTIAIALRVLTAGFDRTKKLHWSVRIFTHLCGWILCVLFYAVVYKLFWA